MMTKKLASAADLITTEIKSFVRNNPLNRMPTSENDFIFDEPLVQFADGDDPIFSEYKNIIGKEHLTPREALAQICGKSPNELPEHLSVISWILPITEKTRLSNRAETLLPSRFWSHTRWHGEIFNDALRSHMMEFLTAKGYLAAAPGLPAYIKMFNNEKGMFSSWSERHIAYAAGLGTFSLSDGFITERGIAHRVGSVVTSLELPPSPRAAKGPYENCLFYVNGKCRVCIERCPAGAITVKGHDKAKCLEYARSIGYNPAQFQKGYDLEKSVAGCGLCQARVPCENRNPARKLKK
ncbi:MAG: epoxyqueuosine reductase [Dehalococcoidales bacterium]|jgi:epoxyqueuosine reductase QueG